MSILPMTNNLLVLSDEQIALVSGGNISQAAFEGGIEGAATGAGIGVALGAYGGPVGALIGGLIGTGVGTIVGAANAISDYDETMDE
jgi:hypothetical protein